MVRVWYVWMENSIYSKIVYSFMQFMLQFISIIYYERQICTVEYSVSVNLNEVFCE